MYLFPIVVDMEKKVYLQISDMGQNSFFLFRVSRRKLQMQTQVLVLFLDTQYLYNTQRVL